MKKPFIATILQLIAGLVFIFSGIIKLFPAEMLEIAIAETGIIGWKLAPFAARLLIAFEIFLGIMLLSRLYNRFFLRLSLFTLIFFTFYLSYLLLAYGNEGNCNCFGTLLPMTPLESIIKNVVLMMMIFYVIKQNPHRKWRFAPALLIVSLIISTGGSFALAPIIVSNYHPSASDLNYRLELELIYDDAEAVAPVADVRNGKWIVAFMSSSCPHCLIAGHKFRVLKQQIPDMQIYLFINGYDNEIDDFVNETRTADLPHSRIKASPLLKLAGPRLPVIYWLDNSIVVNISTIYGISTHELDDWFNQGK